MEQKRSDINKEEAIDFIHLLQQGDMSAWCALAESSFFTPCALIELVEISELGPMESEEPTDKEITLFAAGALDPGRRTMEIAFHIVYSHECRQKFDLFAEPIRESLENLAMKNHARILQIMAGRKPGSEPN